MYTVLILPMSSPINNEGKAIFAFLSLCIIVCIRQNNRGRLHTVTQFLLVHLCTPYSLILCEAHEIRAIYEFCLESIPAFWILREQVAQRRYISILISKLRVYFNLDEFSLPIFWKSRREWNYGIEIQIDTLKVMKVSEREEPVCWRSLKNQFRYLRKYTDKWIVLYRKNEVAFSCGQGCSTKKRSLFTRNISLDLRKNWLNSISGSWLFMDQNHTH